MATKREVFLSLNVDLVGAEKLGEIVVRQKELQRQNSALLKSQLQLKKQLDEGRISQEQYEKAVKVSSFAIGRNRTEIRALSAVLREAENRTGGLTAANLRFRDKMGQAFGDNSRRLIAQFGAQLIASLSVNALVDFSNRLSELAVKQELVERKSRVLFGDSFPKLREEATKLGEAMGKSTTETLALLNAQQDTFRNLGFTREQTAELSKQIVGLAGNLEDWTAGETDAARAAEILQQATLGNTKGLRELGISVKANAEEVEERTKVLMQEQGLTKAQSAALANLEIVYGSVTEVLKDFTEGQETLDDSLDKTNAHLKEAEERLASTWGVTWSKIKANFFDYISGYGSYRFGSAKVGEETRKRIDEEKQLNELLLKGAKAIDINTASVDDLTARLKFLKDAQVAASISGVTPTGGEEIEKIEKRIAAIASEDEELQKRNVTLGEQTKTIKELDVEIAALKEQQEGVNNAADFDALQLRIKALEAQKEAITGVTKAVKELKREAGPERLSLITPGDDAERAKREIADVVKQLVALGSSAEDARFKASLLFASMAADGSIGAEAATVALASLSDQATETAHTVIDANTSIAGSAAEVTRGLEEQAEQREAAHQADLARAEVFLRSQEAIGAAMGEFFAGQERDAAQFGQELTRIFLTAAKNLLRIKLVEAGIISLASPDSVLTFGAAGLIRSAIVTALMEGIFAGLDSALQGFATGGVVKSTGGVITPASGAPITRANGDNVLMTGKVGEKILNDDQQRRAERLYGSDLWKRIGLPETAQRSLIQPFASGGTLTFAKGRGGIADLPTLNQTQIIQAESAAVMAAMQLSVNLNLRDVRDGINDINRTDTRATL